MSMLLKKLLNKLNAPVEGDGGEGGGGLDTTGAVENKEEETSSDDFDMSWMDEDAEVPAAKGEQETTEVPVTTEALVVPEVPVVPEEPVKKEEEKKEEETVVEKTPEELEAQHQAYLSEVEKVFAISEDDANLLLTEPEKVIPKLGAQMHDYTMRKVVEMQQMMLQQLPQYIEQLTTQKNEAINHEKVFLEANPHLAEVDKKELGEMINQYAPLLVKQMAGKSHQEKLVALGDVISTVKGIKKVAPAPKKPESAAPKARPFTPVAPAQSGGSQGGLAEDTPEAAFISMLLNSDE